MTDALGTLRAIVRDEQRRQRFAELGAVTQVFARADEGGKENHQVSVRLSASGVELARAPVAVGRLGLAALPRVGDLVLVVFINGDLNAPVVIGSIYDHQHHPPAAGEHEVVYVVPDEAASDVRRVHLEMPGGATLTFEDERVSVVLGGTSLEMKKDGDVTLTCGGNISLKSNGDVTIEAQGNLALKAQASLELSGAMIKAEGQATASLKAAQVSLAGIVQFSPS